MSSYNNDNNSRGQPKITAQTVTITRKKAPNSENNRVSLTDFPLVSNSLF